MTSPTIYRGDCIRVELLDSAIAELCFDAQNRSINKFDRHTIDELETAIEALQHAPDIQGVLVTSAKPTFIVGADIFEFPALFAQPEWKIGAYFARVNAIFNAFEDLPIPTVAVINGLALGGGLEMALTCDARVMADTTQIGLPEVSLGIFPGFGGTVRLPRIAGQAVATHWISGGQPRSARDALAAGVVDAATHPDALRTTALDLLTYLNQTGDWRARRQHRHGPFTFDVETYRRAHAALQAPAARAAIDLMYEAAGCTRDEALQLERVAFARIARTPAAAALIQRFIDHQARKKRAYV
jgi:3-hydroxyacyl-CoA dehydrogenase / enoyl-CoA hydratase / 3-hydroxybutyryl-CoA epimerase / enoyl-CoA isomerase